MLPILKHGDGGPFLILLHWLGGNSDSWTEVSRSCVERGFVCVALDLPGFGDAVSQAAHRDIAATAEEIVSTIKAVRGNVRGPWFLVGHSMGGKFAAIVARAALDGAPGLEELRGLVMVSPSPPGPEPMDESVRQENIDALGSSTLDAEEDRAHAGSFIDANTGRLPLTEGVRERAIDDLLRADPAAFVAWFNSGSREDWAARVGTLPLPALVLAGTTESALNPDAQREHTLPHLPEAKLVALEGAGHLSPLERPEELADRILAFATDLGLTPLSPAAELDPAARSLIDSNFTSPQTRAVLDQRLADDRLGGPQILTPEELLTLRAAARRIVPGCPFDLAARIHRWLALPAHDGWRHDTLPCDTEAWRTGLHTLDSAAVHRYKVPFSALDAPRQDELLTLARDGKLSKDLLATLHLGDGPAVYTASEMGDWFGDLHAELTRIYIADPRTMHRIGFTGFADEAGFTQIRLNEREEFER